MSLLAASLAALLAVSNATQTSIAPTDIVEERWTHDGNGNLTRIEQQQADGSIHATTRDWDRQGRLTSSTDRYGITITYGYDSVGNRIRREDPQGITTYQPDRLNRSAQVTPQTGGSQYLNYTPQGRLTELRQPNGARESLEYDALGRVAHIVHRQGDTELLTLIYGYDERGNRTTESRTDSSGVTELSYSFDDDDRLTGETQTRPSGTKTSTWTLDDVGNRLSASVIDNATPTVSRSYTYGDRQQLAQVDDAIAGTTTTYQYDGNGTLIQESTGSATTTYRSNPQDRLATLTLPGAPPIDYAYDADGRRVEKQRDGHTVRYGYDGSRLRRESNVTNNLIAAYDWAAGRILSSTENNSTVYAQHDALNSPLRWSRSDGGEQGSTTFSAWGETDAQSGDVPHIGYTGHYQDDETGDYYAEQRYYRPGLGRFTRTDPWEGDTLNPITLNKYLYANGNPLYFTDPTGQYAEAGHYYTPQYIFLRVGFSIEQSQLLAFHAQLPDEVDRLDAVAVQMDALAEGASEGMVNADQLRRGIEPRFQGPTEMRDHRDRIQQGLHTLTSEQGDLETSRTLQAIAAAGGDLAVTGILIHRLGDTFAHRDESERTFPTGFGHGSKGHTPDVIQRRPELYLDYVESVAMIAAKQKGLSAGAAQEFVAMMRDELGDVASIPTVAPGSFGPKATQWLQPTRMGEFRTDGELEQLSVALLKEKLVRLGVKQAYAPETLPREPIGSVAKYVGGALEAKTLAEAVNDFNQNGGIAVGDSEETFAAIEQALQLIERQKHSQRSQSVIIVEDEGG